MNDIKRIRKYRFWRSSRQSFDEQWNEFIEIIESQIKDLGFEIIDGHREEIARRPDEYHFTLDITDEQDKLFQSIMCEAYFNFDFFPVEGVNYVSWFIGRK